MHLSCNLANMADMPDDPVSVFAEVFNSLLAREPAQFRYIRPDPESRFMLDHCKYAFKVRAAPWQIV